MTPEVTEAGKMVPVGQALSANDIYYLQSIKTQLEGVLDDFRKRSYGPTLGGEILADNLDWLDCFIEQHERRSSTLVPATTAALLGEIARIADDYDLREAVDACGPTAIADSFIWRDCIEAARNISEAIQ